MEERLQKIMAQAGIGSRRHNEELIKQGRVSVNGKVATLGDKADARRDKITLDGEPLGKPEEPVYIIIHKPRGVISDEDDQGRQTVRDMVDVAGHLYPVGRLDKQSMGLILLTNDGRVAHLMTHPRYEHEKVYRVKVDGSITSDALSKWRRGVTLEDGRTAPTKIKVLDRDAEFTLLEVTMHEGRKRQIRRVASLLGFPVTHLSRIELGPIKLGDLGLGKWRHLTAHEVDRLIRYVNRGEKRYERKQQTRRRGPHDRRPSRRR